MKCTTPVLLVEGFGDAEAVPFMLRRYANHLGFHTFSPAPRPIKTGSLHKLSRPGELEKFITYGCRRPEGDSVLLCLDCDDGCPAELGSGPIKWIHDSADL